MELRAKKELEFAKLRAQQEKLQDMRGAEDAKRARRAFEAGQREIRKKELEVARKAKALQDELVAARIAQQEEMELRKVRVALLLRCCCAAVVLLLYPTGTAAHRCVLFFCFLDVCVCVCVCLFLNRSGHGNQART